MSNQLEVLLIKASNIDDVRLTKVINSVVTNSSFNLSFVGWRRRLDKYQHTNIKVVYILNGFSNRVFLIFGKLYWYFILFIYLLKNVRKYDIVYAADFEAAFPVYLCSHVNKIKFIYDVYDDISLRYKLPLVIRNILHRVDMAVRQKASALIHVDLNRVDPCDRSYHVLPNVPIDFYQSNFEIPLYKRSIAVTGWLTRTRGINSICCFAADNPNIHFYVIGVLEDKTSHNFLSSLQNVQLIDFIEQNKLFNIIRNCSGIFALYDPSIEINIKAASNKLYDAMMLGIPVIANHGTYFAENVIKDNIGVCVNYSYDGWSNVVSLLNDPQLISKLGKNGRHKYESMPNFVDKINHIFSLVMNS